MFEQYFKNKRILVTGAAGYLGSTVINILKDTECEIARLEMSGNLSSIAGSKAKIMDIPGDIRDADLLEKALENADIIFHFAAQTSTYKANAEPLNDLQINVIPVLTMLEILRKKGRVASFIFSGTVTQMGLPKKLPVDEGPSDDPVTVYDLHKLMAEKYIKYYSKMGHVKGTTLRLANVYGHGPKSSSSDRGILNLMAKRALSGQDITVYGDGSHIRDYIFVKDVARAFLLAAENIETLNGRHCVIGSGEGISLSDAFSLVSERAGLVTGKIVRVVSVDPPKDLSPIEERDFVADSSLFRKTTGWTPMYKLQQGIDETIGEFIKDPGKGG